MTAFQLDTSGTVNAHLWRPLQGRRQYLVWSNLDPFTQGYVEALFSDDATQGAIMDEHGRVRHGFADLAPETLARIIVDCAAFQALPAMDDQTGVFADEHNERDRADAGHDFWLTRNGHGVGFWDGDWPEPYASQLTDAAKAFGSADAYLGDDGKVYLS